MEVGDRVLVMSAMGDNVAIALSTPVVGSNVILYNLQNETRIAVPSLTFSIGDHAFNTPSFDFAGFNWSIDFNFQLIPLILTFYAEWRAVVKRFSNIMNNRNDFIGPRTYGDKWPPPSPLGGCPSDQGVDLLSGGPNGGQVRIMWIDGPCPRQDSTTEIRWISGNRLEVWCYSNNAHGAHHIFYDDDLLCESPVGSGTLSYHGILDW